MRRCTKDTFLPLRWRSKPIFRAPRAAAWFVYGSRRQRHDSLAPPSELLGRDRTSPDERSADYTPPTCSPDARKEVGNFDWGPSNEHECAPAFVKPKPDHDS